jgi:hypothetical protein
MRMSTGRSTFRLGRALRHDDLTASGSSLLRVHSWERVDRGIDAVDLLITYDSFGTITSFLGEY